MKISILKYFKLLQYHIFLFFLSSSLAQNNSNTNKNYIELETFNFKDLNFLDSILEGKRFVFLGESHHGINDFNTAKLSLIKYLHERHQFNIVAFESGIANCGLTNLIKDSLTEMEMLVKSLMGIWRVKGNCNMMAYIQKSGMQILGLDPNSGALPLTTKEYGFFIRKEDLAKRLAAADSLFLHAYSLKKQSYFHQSIKLDLKELESVQHMLKNQYQTLKQEVENYKDLSMIQRSLLLQAIQVKLMELNCSLDVSSDNYFLGTSVRDSIMANQLLYYSDSLFKSDKFIIWGHNAHIAKQAFDPSLNGGVCMGKYLPQRIKEVSFILGIYAVSGQYANGFNAPRKINLKRHSLEWSYRLISSKAAYVNSQQIGLKKYRHGIPNIFSSNVQALYDGLLLIKEVEASRLIPFNQLYKCE